MGCDPLALGKNLDGAGSYPHPNLLAQELVRDRVIVSLHIDMVVQRHGAQLPLGVDIGGHRQRLERRPVQPVEQVLTAGPEVARDLGVDPGVQRGDGGVQIIQREEPLVAQPRIVPKARLRLRQSSARQSEPRPRPSPYPWACVAAPGQSRCRNAQPDRHRSG